MRTKHHNPRQLTIFDDLSAEYQPHFRPILKPKKLPKPKESKWRFYWDFIICCLNDLARLP